MWHRSVASVAINLRPRSSSWGGANQWALQVCRHLRESGYQVRFDLRKRVDLILMTHTGLSAGTTFLDNEVAEFRQRFPRTPCIQRINDNDIRKSTDKMDALLARANRVATHTVFVSHWLRQYHSERWFDARLPHSVIEPGADPSVFHPFGTKIPGRGEPWRIVTHHWSDNMAKGFDVYEAIDRAIGEGRLPGCRLRIIGRWPGHLNWRSAELMPPVSGPALAARLRKCQVYVSASRFEPGAMHVVEGIQCGLPIAYHRDSGGTVEMGERYGLVLGDDPVPVLRDLISRYGEFRSGVLSGPPSGDRMAFSYRELIQREICRCA